MGIMPVVAGVAQAKAEVAIRQKRVMRFMKCLQPIKRRQVCCGAGYCLETCSHIFTTSKTLAFSVLVAV